MEIDDAVALFSLMFQLSIWAVGFIMIAYFLAIVKVLLDWTKKIRFGSRK